jgi:hypothetical protein
MLRGQPMLATLQFSVGRDPGLGPAPVVRALHAGERTVVPVATQVPASHPARRARNLPARRQRAAAHALALLRNAQARLPQVAATGVARRLHRFRSFTLPPAGVQRLPAGRLPENSYLADASRFAREHHSLAWPRASHVRRANALLTRLRNRSEEWLDAWRQRQERHHLKQQAGTGLPS